jgi:hypothetical protein
MFSFIQSKTVTNLLGTVLIPFVHACFSFALGAKGQR